MVEHLRGATCEDAPLGVVLTGHRDVLRYLLQGVIPRCTEGFRAHRALRQPRSAHVADGVTYRTGENRGRHVGHAVGTDQSPSQHLDVGVDRDIAGSCTSRRCSFFFFVDVVFFFYVLLRTLGDSLILNELYAVPAIKSLFCKLITHLLPHLV